MIPQAEQGEDTPPAGQTAFDVATESFLWQLAPPEDEHPGDGGPADTDLPAVQDDDALDRVLRDYLGVKLPNLKCCDGHRTPWDAVHNAFFARSEVAVWKASRGMGGKSFTLSALAMAEALFLRADVNILGGSGEQSKRILEAIGKLWDAPGFPRQCMKSEEPSAQRQQTIWLNKIVALMASQTSVRGPHPQRLRMDEVDEMNLGILDSALGQPMSKGWILSHVVLSSTHQYPAGTMSEMLKRALDKGWPVFEWCYRENLEPHGWLSLAEVERKRAVLTTKMWDTEIELQEPSSEGRAIDTTKIDLAFQLAEPLEIGKHHVTFEAPDPAGRYATAADWAKKKNHTVIVTIRKDVRPKRVVKITRMQKLPWPDMVAAYNAQAKEYGAPKTAGSTQAHDNTGMGSVIADYIQVDAEDFNMVGQQRKDLLSNYVNAIERQDLILPRVAGDTNLVAAAVYGEHKYATVDDLYKGTKDGSGKFHLPDTISAGALAWRAADQPEAISGMVHQDLPQAPHLQQGFTRGRLSGYAKRADQADTLPPPDPGITNAPVVGRPRLSIFGQGDAEEPEK